MAPYNLHVVNGLVVTAPNVDDDPIAIEDKNIGLLDSKGTSVGIAATRVIDSGRWICHARTY